MPKSYFLLELFPMELLHEIFDYLSTIDILHAFSNINFYLDSALSKYEQFHINFRSCHRIDVDCICSYIQPHQIISLILSNSDDTPDQFQLFFSKFNIEQFTRLRSIILIDIEKHILLKLINILNNNNNCPRLESLKIISEHYPHTTLPDGILRKFCSRQLRRLEVYKAYYMDLHSLSHLRYLTVHDCKMNKFQQILSSIPMLLSLQVTNHSGKGDQWIPINKVPIRLKRLALNLDVRLSMYDLEDFLCKLPNLQHLELQIIGNLFDLCNGQRWSIIAERLLTFNFNFLTENVIIICPHLLINSFRSLFWLEEKRWFVAYDHRPSRVFTVPHFADTSASYNERHSFCLPLHTTVPSDHSLFFDCINSLTISNHLCESISSHYFAYVKILSVPNPKLIEQLQGIVDLTQVQCLKLSDIIHTDELGQLIPTILPRVSELHLRALPIGDQHHLTGIKQIRTLHIQILDSSSRLYRQFPYIECLQIERVGSFRQICSILNYSKSHLSFVSLSWSLDIHAQQSFQFIQNWFEQQSIRHRDRSKFTYRCHTRYLPTINLWINNNVEQSVHISTIRLLGSRVFYNISSLRNKLFRA